MEKMNVVAVIIRDSDKVFATARCYGEYKGWWEFPGGKIKDGETPEEALVRTIKEEWDFDIEVLEYIDTIEYDYPQFHLSMKYYFCNFVSGELTLKETANARWLTRDSIDSVKWLPSNITIIEKIKHILSESNKSTLDYYNQNASQFVLGTISVEFNTVQDKFLELLPNGGIVLDFGCGSGRDTKYFIKKGYKVDATDGSFELCKSAGKYTGIEVKQMLFTELSADNLYDGIWACSSILHLSKAELMDVFRKMAQATKVNGYIYTSFKYGDFEGYRNERYFTDFTEISFEDYIKDVPGIRIIEYWISEDVRPGRGEEKWLNLILQKSDTVCRLMENIIMLWISKASHI